MAFVLTDVRLFTGGSDLSGRSNKLEITSEFGAEDTTNFRSAGWKEVAPGLASTEIEAEGQWEAGDPTKVDDQLWTALGGLGAWTMCPTDATLGALAWLTRAMTASYQLGGEVGKIAPWTGAAKGSWPLVRGQIAHPPGTARTATGTGTGAVLGAVATGRHLYAALHVLSVAGTAAPTITVGIESDEDNVFASAVDRITFAPATIAGGQILRSASPFTDTWFRPKWTITGTSPSFLFALAYGVA